MGRLTSARASATRCRWPPESWPGLALAVAGQLDQRQRLLGRPLALGLGHAAHHQPVGDVVDDVQVREQRVVLEHRVDVAPVGRHALGRLAEDLDVAGRRLLEAGDQAQAGRLAGAGGAEHGEELAGFDVEVDPVDGAHGTVMARDGLEGDGCGHGLEHPGDTPHPTSLREPPSPTRGEGDAPCLLPLWEKVARRAAPDG